MNVFIDIPQNEIDESNVLWKHFIIERLLFFKEIITKLFSKNERRHDSKIVFSLKSLDVVVIIEIENKINIFFKIFK